MAGKIPQYFIDDLLDRVDIVDVVNTRVQLKKTGKNYSACCPFHDEKTPSFTVSPDKQFYYCFGCKASGNALGFVMDYDRFSFPEAIEQLARDIGMEVPREETTPFEDERARQKKRLHDTLKKADSFYRQQLRQHPVASTAVDYLKQRGLSGQIAAAFGIGFAPPGWENLLKALGEDADAVHLQIETGLLIEKPEESKRYDRFRNRIMFPIRDTRGRTIAFGGRVLGDDKPKYLNSPETPVFHKGRELYGLYEANQSQDALNDVLVVEGYMDVVALAQFDINNAVATLGTAISSPHLEKLYRYTPEVVFCFDGDLAGTHAAHRALENALPLMTDGRSAKFLFLPDGEDPDTLVRQIGTDAFRDLIKNAVPLSEFLFKTVSEGLNTETPDGKARLSTLAAPYLNTIPPGIFRELMISQLATLTGLDPSKLDSLISDGGQLASAKAAQKQKPQRPAEQPQQPQQRHPQGEPSTDTVETAAPAPDAIPGYSDFEAPPSHYDESYEPHGEGNYGNYEYSQKRAPNKRSKRSGKFSKDHYDKYASDVPATHSGKRIQLTPERTIVAILLNNPQLASETDCLDELKGLASKEIKLFVDLAALLQQYPDYTLNHILGYWRGIYGAEQGKLLAEIAASDLVRPPKDAERDNLREFHDVLTILKRRAQEDLPPLQQLTNLLNQEHLDEHDIKAIYKIWPYVAQGELSQELKDKQKQLVARRK